MMSVVKKYTWGLILMSLSMFSMSIPNMECPSFFNTDGMMNDLGLLSEMVSWDHKNSITGVCGNYSIVYTKDGIYDTRIRIYNDINKNKTVIVFRPTQQTTEGERIHQDRRLSACQFMNHTCYGLVHHRFQEAFMDLIKDLRLEKFLLDKVYTTGHSLGGSFQLFMAIYLIYIHDITPVLSIGWAGPFIGDVVFTETYQIPLKKIMQNNWWQVESINSQDRNDFDGTVESYNVYTARPKDILDPWSWFPQPTPPPQAPDADKTPIFIQGDVICALETEHLSDSYGMHDLKNYRHVLDGKECK